MKTYIPTDEMRTSSLSLVPGGSVIRVVYKGYQKIFTRIKYPDAYIKTLMGALDLTEIYVDDRLVYKRI